MVAVSNLIGLAGLICAAVAVGGLTGNWWWALLSGGLAVAGLAWMAQRNATAVEAVEPETAAPVKPVARLADRVSRPA